MAYAVWPGTLPAAPLEDGYHSVLPNNLIVSEVDIGPAKVRRRTTANVAVRAVRFIFTKAQLDAFKAFYLTTLQSGALPFQWTDPETAATVLVRFAPKSPPSYSMKGPDIVEASFTLEVLP